MFQEAYFQIGQVILAGQKMNIVDVGGAGGLIPHWSVFQGNAKFFMYEPREDACKQLDNIYANSPFRNDFRFIPTALSGTGGFRKLYVTNSPSSSSILRPNITDERYKNHSSLVPFKEHLIRTETLTNSLNEEGINLIDGIKLDVQGAELEILKGLNAERLKNLFVIEMEAGLIDVYEGVPSLGEIMEFVKANGFELYDMRSQRFARTLPNQDVSYMTSILGVPENSPSVASRIYELDLLFFRRPESVLSNGPSDVRKLIFSQCVFNFFGEAMHIIAECEKHSIFTQEERNQLFEMVKLWHQVNSQVLANYNTLLQANHYQTWGQYAWVPYPCQ